MRNFIQQVFICSRPGFTRLNLSFFSTDDEIEYILNAVQFVATEGWKFLPLVSDLQHIYEFLY
jgi:hypothetical protein